MKAIWKILAGSLTSAAFLLSYSAAMAAGSKEARVTQIIREVKLLPAEAAARDAALNDKISDDTGVRTGGDSRSELTFPDLTITRLGANTIFSFSKSGRTANVDTGSILLRVPKDSGGGSIRSSAVTVAITGTTVIFEGTRGGRSKLITLEGSARVSLKKKPSESRKVLAGQMLDVPAGATTLPMPVNIDLNDLMRTHPLITDFKPLPSQPLIVAAARNPPPLPPPTYNGPIIGPGPRPIVVNNPPPNRGPKQNPSPTPRPNREGPNQPSGADKAPPTPTPPPVITRTNPSPSPTKTQTPTKKVTKKPTSPSGPR
jgi:hypothetical protein